MTRRGVGRSMPRGQEKKGKKMTQLRTEREGDFSGKGVG